jgi:hypothetical protein
MTDSTDSLIVDCNINKKFHHQQQAQQQAHQQHVIPIVVFYLFVHLLSIGLV